MSSIELIFDSPVQFEVFKNTTYRGRCECIQGHTGQLDPAARGGHDMRNVAPLSVRLRDLQGQAMR